MQAIQWSADSLVIIATLGLTLALAGFLLASLLKGKHNSRLALQLEQAQAELQEKHEQLRANDACNQERERRLHEKEVAAGRLETRLDNACANTNRLQAELEAACSSTSEIAQKLESSDQCRHTAEKRLEAAQSDTRALRDSIDTLEQRLKIAIDAIQKERTAATVLQEKLGNEGRRAEAAESEVKSLREQRDYLNQQLKVEKNELKNLQDKYQQLGNAHTELETSLKEKEAGFEKQLAQLSDAKKSLTQEFELLANKIFEEKGKTFTQTSQSSIDHLLKPFREQIDGFQKRVNDVHDASLKGNADLNAEIKKVLDIGLSMSHEASNLTSALKGDSQQRGAWGEAQLLRTLEMSGLVAGTHFEGQESFKDVDGKTKRTDYLIKLPDGKQIIIDSKVTLNAYDELVEAATPELQKLAMNKHIRAVRSHIDDLAGKDYTNLIGMRSPSFVLMFMPIEPAYIEALKHDKGLFEYGFSKGIVLVSHTTLIPILRTVSNLWMIERSNSEAREIAEKAGGIYNQVRIIAEHMTKLGNTLKTASGHYNKTITALAGQQGLYGKVERFNQLSAKVSKELPELAPNYADFEAERLTLIAEPIDEPPVPQAALNSQAPTLPADNTAVPDTDRDSDTEIRPTGKRHTDSQAPTR